MNSDEAQPLEAIKDKALESLRLVIEIVERQSVDGFVIWLSFAAPDEHGNDCRMLVQGKPGLLKFAPKEIKQLINKGLREKR